MKHLNHFNEFGANESFSTLAKGFGKVAGKVKSAVSDKLKSRGMPAGEPKNVDEDLANAILTHLSNISREYRSGDEYRIGEVNKIATNSYMIVDFIFNNTKYRVDMMKHIDYKTTKDPEYTITIAKVKGQPKTPTGSNKTYGGLGSGINLRGHGTPQQPRNPTYGGIESFTYEKSERLKCSQKLAERIYKNAEEIHRLVKGTGRGDARGGSNQPNT